MQIKNQAAQEQAHAELLKQTKHAMMSCHDSRMWSLCEGVLEHATIATAHTAAVEGDCTAAEVLSRYISYLEKELSK